MIRSLWKCQGGRGGDKDLKEVTRWPWRCQGAHGGAKDLEEVTEALEEVTRTSRR